MPNVAFPPAAVNLPPAAPPDESDVAAHGLELDAPYPYASTPLAGRTPAFHSRTGRYIASPDVAAIVSAEEDRRERAAFARRVARLLHEVEGLSSDEFIAVSGRLREYLGVA